MSLTNNKFPTNFGVARKKSAAADKRCERLRFKQSQAHRELKIVLHSIEWFLEDNCIVLNGMVFIACLRYA